MMTLAAGAEIPKREKISVIVPVHNRKDVTLACLAELARVDAAEYTLDIVVVDDGSTDGTEDAVRKAFPRATILKGDGNLWWAGSVNLGMRHVAAQQADYVLLMNDDNQFTPRTLAALYEQIRGYSRRIVGSVAVNKDTGRIHCIGHWKSGPLDRLIPLHQGQELDRTFPRVLLCDSVSSRFVLMRSNAIRDIGMFRADKFPHHYSDLDYFLGAKAKGYEVCTVTDSIVATEVSLCYHKSVLLDSSRLEYVRSLFSIRFSNNFPLVVRRSFSHRSFHQACLLCAKEAGSLLKWLLLKLVIPNRLLFKMAEHMNV